MRRLDAQPVLGNHDVHLLRVAAGTRSTGRRDTLDELLAAPDRDELLGWLAAQPFVRGFHDLVMLHAAIDPRADDPATALTGIDPLTPNPKSDFATRARYCDNNGERPAEDWPPPAAPFVPWFEHWEARPNEQRTVVFGHWARLGLVKRTRVRGLDTGCVWGKQLTAWIAEEDRFVQVDAARVYSPTSLPDSAFDGDPHA